MLQNKEISDLKNSKQILENPMFLIEISNIVGKPIEKIYTLLPDGFQQSVGKATKSVLMKSLDMMVSNMNLQYISKPQNLMHKGLVTFTGIVGGLFGLTALTIELPVTTAIMLRSIIDIARCKGLNINDMDTKIGCLEVFALGGKSKNDDNSDNAYYLARGALAKAVTEANKYLLEKRVVNESVPVLLEFISKVAARFSIVVSEEAAAKAIPIIGSVSGGAINLLFMTHFQRMADGHFTVKFLENKYGKEKVKDIYMNL